MKKQFFGTTDSLSLLVIWIWIKTILLDYFRAFIMHLPIVGQYADIILSTMFVVVLLLAMPKLIFTVKDVLFFLCVVVVFNISLLFIPATEFYTSQYMNDFLLGILPLYFIGVSLYNKENHSVTVHYMYLCSMLTIVASIVYKVFISAPMDSISSQYVGSMDHAYKLLPHCCLVAYFAMHKPKVVNIILTLLALGYLLMLGTRGAAAILFAFVLFSWICRTQSKKIVGRACIAAVVLYFFVNSSLFSQTILFLSKEAESLGLSIRIFDKALTDTATVSIAREVIKDAIYKAIAENPIVGYGLYSDRVIANGSYAHNIVLELWVEFGVFWGSGIFLSMLYYFVYGFYREKDVYGKGLILALCFSSFSKLFVSGSYLNEQFLFFLIGCCVACVRNANISMNSESPGHKYIKEKVAL